MNEIILINSDVYVGLNSLDDQSIDIAVTSPPYWNQRDYGFEGQIGNELSYQEYIAKLTVIFNVLKNKLKSNGVFFLNIGDKYLSKYGKSPLAFIPFKLAYEMVKNGWYLNDILIWYKPNHMPSSIKNRFTNSYEPVFALSPSKENIFNDYKNCSISYTSILKVNLQPTPYKHVAVYPEKLVKSLFGFFNPYQQFSVLDPFAGSGTTLKAIIDYFQYYKAYMIECNKSYINIIRERCNLTDNYIIKEYKYEPFTYNLSCLNPTENEQISLFTKYTDYVGQNKKSGIIKITNSKRDFLPLLQKFLDKSIMSQLNMNALCFIGSREYDLDLILQATKLNEKGWVIRNLLIVQENNTWFPLFMIVDDNKSVNYVFQFKNLNLKSKSDYNRNWSNTDFIGYPVYDNLSKNKRKGIVISILEYYDNLFPKYVVVEWEAGKLTKEFIIQDQDSIDSNLIFNLDNPISVNEIVEYISLDKEVNENNLYNTKKRKSILKEYNGKFKDIPRKNWGASPGARSSIEDEYFSLQRLYNVNQKLVSDYLNHKRIERGYSKNEFSKLFPHSYKHTIGHWLRKDFGGSIPTPEDWDLISSILDIDQKFTKYVCASALKLQTVKHSNFKMPDDFIDKSFLKNLKKLFQ